MKLTTSLNNNEDYYNATQFADGWYPAHYTITNAEEAKEIFCSYNYSPHLWKDGIRSKKSYIASYYLVVDFDNGLKIEEVKQRFRDIIYILVTSRNHNIIKAKHEDLGAVPRFHVIFPFETTVSDPGMYHAYLQMDMFDDSDPVVHGVERFNFKSPDDAECSVNLSGDYIDKLYTPPVTSYSKPKANTQTHLTENDLDQIIDHCEAVNKVFSDIRNDHVEESAGHYKRILAANMISNTIDDEKYVTDLFSNVNDYDEKKTLEQYESIKMYRPITCKRLQTGGWHNICPATCPLMKDINKKSPIAFAYRDETGLKLTQDLFADIENEDSYKELLKRARSFGVSPEQEILITRIAGLKGVTPAKVEKQMKGLSFDDHEVQDKTLNWYRIGPKFNEVIVLPEKSDIRITKRADDDVKERLGPDAKGYIIREKSLPDPIDYDFIGGGGKPLSFEETQAGFIGYAPLAAVNIPDNPLIEDTLEEWFGSHTEFIKSWIAYYTYSNFEHLPTLIITGGRGTGKSKFAELVGMIYEELSGRFDTKTHYTEHNGLKLAYIEEADEFDNKNLYSIIKDIGGSEKLIKNIKYGPKFSVRNNLNLILISNNRIPLYLKSSEKPIDENNNQFFVHEFKPLIKNIDGALIKKIRDRIGYWLRTEIKDLYDLLEARPDKDQCRYLIPVPITKNEELLFENNKTETEILIEEFLEKLETDYIIAEDLKTLARWDNNAFHSLKRKLVDMNVIISMSSHSDKRNLIDVKGIKHEKPRYYKLTPEFREKKLEILPQK